jgi:hypothetical protein
VDAFSPIVNRLAASVVVAVGMWATRLRCPSCPQQCDALTSLAAIVDGKAAPCAFVFSRTHRSSGNPVGALQRRQHAGENLEPRIFFVAQAVGAALDHPDLVVEPLDEAERDLVLKPAVGRDPVPLSQSSAVSSSCLPRPRSGDRRRRHAALVGPATPGTIRSTWWERPRPGVFDVPPSS